MYATSDFRRGLKIIFQNAPCEIVGFEHHKPGKGAAIVRTKLKNLINGAILDPTFRSGDKVAIADVEEREVKFLYKKNEVFYFMDLLSFDQFAVSIKIVGDCSNFIIENIPVTILFFSQNPISILLPNNVDLTITDCPPAIRGDTVSGATKLARVETGYSCQVPLFVTQGDKIKIDTRSGQYLERV